MAVSQSVLQQSVRAVSRTAFDYDGDFRALFTAQGITATTFNEALLGWINSRLGVAYVNLPSAMEAYAASHGFSRWQEMTSIQSLLGVWTTDMVGATADSTLRTTDNAFMTADAGAYTTDSTRLTTDRG